MGDLLPIDFKNIKASLVQMLGIQGARSRPAHVDMSRVQPVVDVSGGGDIWLNEEAINGMLAATFGTNLENEMSTDMQVVAYGVTPSAGIYGIVNPKDHNLMLFQFAYQFTLGEAWRIANSNKHFRVQLQVRREADALEAYYTVGETTHIVYAGSDGYVCYNGGYTNAYHSGNGLPNILPAGMRMRIIVSQPCDPGDEFMFDDTCDWQAWVMGLPIPCGAPIPRVQLRP